MMNSESFSINARLAAIQFWSSTFDCADFPSLSEKNKQTWITAGDEHALPLYVDHMFTSPLKPKVVYHYHKHYKGYLYKHLE